MPVCIHSLTIWKNLTNSADRAEPLLFALPAKREAPLHSFCPGRENHYAVFPPIFFQGYPLIMNKRRRKQNDLRFIKAEHVIRSSFLCLMAETGFDELSVTDIVTKAQIGRGTFYLHYKDKYDLLHTFEKELTDDVQEIIQNIQTTGLAAVRRITIELFTYFEKNITKMRALFGEKGDFGFQNRIKEMVWYAEFSKFFVQSIRENGSAVPSEYLASYIESSIHSLFLTWLKKERRESPEEITAIIMELILTTMRPPKVTDLTPE